jgi:hypothetical protein
MCDERREFFIPWCEEFVEQILAKYPDVTKRPTPCGPDPEQRKAVA